MLDVAKVNPVLKSDKDVENYNFLTFDGDLYLISNTITGDDAYREDVVIPAGEYLNGFMVEAWKGQKLVVDEKHINYKSSKTYADITAGTTLLKANTDGKLEIVGTAPTSGIYFKVTDKCILNEKAIKVKVIVVDAISAS